MPTDELLQECIEQAHADARLGRTDDLPEPDALFAEILADLEAAGVAMRYVDPKGRVAWRTTKLLRDHLEDLRLEMEADFEHEDT
jgi:hypothetical protein